MDWNEFRDILKVEVFDRFLLGLMVRGDAYGIGAVGLRSHM